MFFRNTTLSFLMVIVIVLCTLSCSDDNNSTNASSSANKCTADVTGDTIYTFSSTKGSITKSSLSNEYTILLATIISGNNDITNLTLWFKDTGKYDTPFDLSLGDNYAQLSFKGGAIAYKSTEGTLTISEKVGNRVKATFSFKAVNQNDFTKHIEVKNGVFDFSL